MQAGLRISFLMKWFLHNKRLCVRNSGFEKMKKTLIKHSVLLWLTRLLTSLCSIQNKTDDRTEAVLK
jgi:hypothetical protein